VRAAQRAGTRVLGYVATGYGARGQDAVTADVDRYEQWYGVDGIFLDEAAPGEAELPYYRALAGHVRASGLRPLVLNPGLVPARAYFDVADIVVAFEGAAADFAGAHERLPDWLHELPAGRVAYLVYAAGAEQAVAVADAADGAYIYATSGVQPNPWRTIPDYLEQQAEPIASCAPSH
jgi:Spherulation-specific family 4